MKLAEIVKGQEAMLEVLRLRALDGDNQAAEVYLNQLSRMSQAISEWQKNQTSPKTPVQMGTKSPTSFKPKQNDPDLDPFS